MIVETAVLAMILVGIGLLVGLLVSFLHGNMDDVALFGMALLTGVTGWAWLIALILAVVFACKGDYRKSVFVVFGFIIGIVLFVGLIATIIAGLGETATIGA